MSYPKIGLMLVLCVLLAADALAHTNTTSPYAQLIEQPKPEYPASERRRGREGWVVLNYTVNEEGVVVDPSIEDSSGSDAFNAAALEAVQDWHFESAEEQKSNVLLNFVYDQRRLRLSRKFFSRNAKVHKSIDRGKLDDAQERLLAIRDGDDLSAFELAYSSIAEGRIASKRGDQVEQLRCFRRAMLNQGRWLKRDNYLKLLYATVVLAIQQQDFASALRDYALLVETSPGRTIAADLEGSIQAVRALVDGNDNIAPPYMVANMEMTIELELHTRAGEDAFREGPPGGGDDFADAAETEQPETPQ